MHFNRRSYTSGGQAFAAIINSNVCPDTNIKSGTYVEGQSSTQKGTKAANAVVQSNKRAKKSNVAYAGIERGKSKGRTTRGGGVRGGGSRGAAKVRARKNWRVDQRSKRNGRPVLAHKTYSDHSDG